MTNDCTDATGRKRRPPGKRQSPEDRLLRLKDRRCPVHGVCMPQVSDFFEQKGGRYDGAEVCIVQCCRRDCQISGVQDSPNSPIELLPEWRFLFRKEVPRE